MFSTKELACHLNETTSACGDGIKFLKDCETFEEAYARCSYPDLHWFLQWTNSFRRIKLEDIQDQLEIHLVMLGIMCGEERDIALWRRSPRTKTQYINSICHIIKTVLNEAYPGEIYPDYLCDAHEHFRVANMLKNTQYEYMLVLVKQYFSVEMIMMDMAFKVLSDIHEY